MHPHGCHAIFNITTQFFNKRCILSNIHYISIQEPVPTGASVASVALSHASVMLLLLIIGNYHGASLRWHPMSYSLEGAQR